MNWTKTQLGQEYKGQGFLMFFGTQLASLEKLQQAYPHLSFRFLNQVHGDVCVQSNEKTPEADAHYTSEKNIALCIRTADCIPALVASTDQVLAVHAGWRGVLNKIIPKSMALVFKNEAPLCVSLGPHIQKESFQVDLDLGHEFGTQFGKKFVIQDQDTSNKAHVNLKAIVTEQIHSSQHQFWSSAEDTLTSHEYYSHRAEPTNKGRNISFVARL